MGHEETGEDGEAERIPWESLQATLSNNHWALQDFLRSVVVRDPPADGRISPCPRCKGNGKGPPGDGGLAHRKQQNLQQALLDMEATSLSSSGRGRPEVQRSSRYGMRSMRPFAVLWRWRGLEGLMHLGRGAPWERQCWFCDGVGIMPVVNLHGYLCAWAPAALNTLAHPYFPLPPTPALVRRAHAQARERRRRRVTGSSPVGGRVCGLRVLRVGKAQKVTGESVQRFVGSLVPEFEVRDRAEQSMPHWHDGRQQRRRRNLLEFDWRRAQWIADVQNIVESGEAPPSSSAAAPDASVSDGAMHATASLRRRLAKAAHLTGGERRGAGLDGLRQMVGQMRWGWRGEEGQRQRRHAGEGEDAGGVGDGSAAARLLSRHGVQAHEGPSDQRSSAEADDGAGRVMSSRGSPSVATRGGVSPGPRGRPARTSARPVTLDAEFPEDLVSIRPGYEEGDGSGGGGAVREVTFRDRIFYPRLRSSPLLQPMLRISEALSLNFLGEQKPHHGS